MSLELIVFDLAGTTVKDNKDVHRIFQKVFAKYDMFISIAEANTVMGIPKPVAIRQLLESNHGGSNQITQKWVDEIHKVFVKEMIEFYKTDPGISENEGVSETFSKLKERKLKVVVDTGFDRITTNALLSRLNWNERNLIDGSVTSDEVERGRPYPDMIFKAMALTGTKEVGNVAKVGDTAFDLQEGSSAGCGYVIGITTGAFLKEDLRKEIHTHLIERIPEVLEILT